MCGITGGISLYNSYDFKDEVLRMNNKISHRGPDSDGIYIDTKQKVCFGHRRLAILDLSELGHQPMQIDDYVISYNGEVYNFLELRTELEDEGVVFKSNSDTEVLLQAYIKWGQNFVSRLNGMWAFAIFDPKREEVFCSRDRFGIKPFYYIVYENRFYFASEIKALLEINGYIPTLNLSKAYDFLADSLVSHTEDTMFADVKELRGGHNILINLDMGSLKVESYFQINDRKNTYDNFSLKEHLSFFRSLFKDAVKISLRSDVKVGSALSGGLDSSTIVAIVNETLSETGDADKQECVSACYSKSDKGIDESFYIDVLAADKKINIHKVQPSWDHLVDNLDKLIWHQDEPFPTLSIYAQFTVFEEASKRNLIVMLDGQGADEILAGYESFYEGYFKELIRTNIFSVFPALFGYIIKHKQYPFEKLFNKLSNKSNQNQWFLNRFKSNSRPYIRNEKKSVRGMSEDYLEHFGLHSLLKYEDRNSMAFSVESRVPFLDYRVVEYALNAPTSIKINRGLRKYILREAFKKILPKAIYSRYDKLGFPTPQERWTIENIDNILIMLKDALNELNDLLDVKAFDNAEKYIINGDKSFIFLVWRIIIFARWKKLFGVTVKLN